jgi:uncharacterized protein
MKDHSSKPQRSQVVIKVTPNVRKSEFLGWAEDEQGRQIALVKLAASPVEGKANKELLSFLAELLGCSKRDIELVRGDTSRSKAVSLPALLATRFREMISN